MSGCYSAATFAVETSVSSYSTKIETRGTCLLPISVSKVCGSHFTL